MTDRNRVTHSVIWQGLLPEDETLDIDVEVEAVNDGSSVLNLQVSQAAKACPCHHPWCSGPLGSLHLSSSEEIILKDHPLCEWHCVLSGDCSFPSAGANRA